MFRFVLPHMGQTTQFPPFAARSSHPNYCHSFTCANRGRISPSKVRGNRLELHTRVGIAVAPGTIRGGTAGQVRVVALVLPGAARW